MVSPPTADVPSDTKLSSKEGSKESAPTPSSDLPKPKKLGPPSGGLANMFAGRAEIVTPPISGSEESKPDTQKVGTLGNDRGAALGAMFAARGNPDSDSIPASSAGTSEGGEKKVGGLGADRGAGLGGLFANRGVGPGPVGRGGGALFAGRGAGPSDSSGK